MVVLSRDYIVKVKARSGRQAKKFAEHFLSRDVDMPNVTEGDRKQFKVIAVKMAANDALESTVWEEK